MKAAIILLVTCIYGAANRQRTFTVTEKLGNNPASILQNLNGFWVNDYSGIPQYKAVFKDGGGWKVVWWSYTEQIYRKGVAELQVKNGEIHKTFLTRSGKDTWVCDHIFECLNGSIQIPWLFEDKRREVDRWVKVKEEIEEFPPHLWEKGRHKTIWNFEHPLKKLREQHNSKFRPQSRLLSSSNTAMRAKAGTRPPSPSIPPPPSNPPPPPMSTTCPPPSTPPPPCPPPSIPPPPCPQLPSKTDASVWGKPQSSASLKISFASEDTDVAHMPPLPRCSPQEATSEFNKSPTKVDSPFTMYVEEWAREQNFDVTSYEFEGKTCWYNVTRNEWFYQLRVVDPVENPTDNGFESWINETSRAKTMYWNPNTGEFFQTTSANFSRSI